jgi:hypothetical protein
MAEIAEATLGRGVTLLCKYDAGLRGRDLSRGFISAI